MRRYPMVMAGVTAILVGLAVREAWALAMETHGNEPLSELNFTEWKGIMPVINDKARVYGIWVNGNEHLYFKGTTKELNAALAHFAKVEVKDRIVVLQAGPGMRKSLDKKEIAYNWELHIVGGIAKTQATRDKEKLYWFEDPVLTVQIDGDIDLKKLDIPKDVEVRSGKALGEDDKKHLETQKKIAEFVAARKKDAEGK